MREDLPIEVLAFAMVVGGITLLSWIRSRTKATALAFIRLYEQPSLPIFMRNWVGLMWLWAVAALFGAIAVVVPRWLGQWIVLVIIAVAYAAFALSYRVPAPFLPAWLRKEIQSGNTLVARPDAGDWLLFVFATAMVALSIPAALILIIGIR